MSHADGKIKLNGKEYTIVTIDYETYFDQEYTLSKSMNTSEYVRDERFEAYLVGIKIGNGPTQIYTEADVIPALKRIDWSNHAFLAHNTQFDGLVTVEALGINPPALWLDTLAMARACLPHTKNHKLDTVAKYFGLAGKVKASALQNMKGVRNYTPEMLAACGEYCIDDVDMCYDIFWKMYEAIPDKELRLIHETTRMFCQGQALVDVDRVRTELSRELAHKAQALNKVGLPISTLMSNDSLADAIRQRGIEPPTKISPTTGKEAYAFAKSDLEFQALADDPRVADLIAARLAVKSTLGETRAGRFINAGTTGKLPVALNFYGARTGRWSGGNKMNLQNLPRGSELRRSIMAPPGHKIVVCDSSQIEARVLAWLAGQESLLEQFRNKADIYSAFASIVYGRPVDRKRYDEHGNKPDELEGMVGKVCVAADTLVLTQRGWIPIIYVTSTDKVWDGIEWVNNNGVIYQGYKDTLTAHGLTATPDHEVLMGDSWVEWREALTPSVFPSVLNSATLPSSNESTATKLGITEFSALVETHLSSPKVTSSQVEQPDATSALNKQREKSDDLNTAQSYPTQNIGADSLTESAAAYNDATTQKVAPIKTTEGEESKCTVLGAKTAVHSCDILSTSKGGTTQTSISTASTTTEGTSQETYDSFLVATMHGINAKSATSKLESNSLRQKTHVYDLLNCGPRSRFTVLTAEGPVVIHNCILGLGYQMGAAKLQDTFAKGMMGPKVDFTLDECRHFVNTYRSANYMIAALWQKMDHILRAASVGQEGTYKCLSWGKDYIRLPNGMFLHYPALTVTENDQIEFYDKYGVSYIYGGLATENAVQALARIIVAEQMLDIIDADPDYNVMTMTHDEVVVICPDEKVDTCLDDMLRIMRTPPTWAPDLPLDAEGGYAQDYSK